MRLMAKFLVLGLAAVGFVLPTGAAAVSISDGVMVGDVTSSSALLWARADQDSTLHVRLYGGRHGRIASAAADASRDYTVRVPIDGLAPGTEYGYRAWFGNGPVVTGSFRTAPLPNDATRFRLAFGGDLAGQNVCRDSAEGFPILDTVRARRPDVFVGLGDMIYADNGCASVGMYGNNQIPGDAGPAEDLAAFWAHYHYARSEPKLQQLLAGTDYFGVWDDHEVVNDFGPSTDIGVLPGVHLMPIGLRAFLDYTPVAQSAPDRLYRTFRWGRNAQVFALDTRQYRDPNFMEDSDANPKTMLGAEQLPWLKQELMSSDATWKVIVSSVPMSIPTGFPPTNGRDGWANYDQSTGYEHELLDILRFMHDHGIRNTVWITTDVHFGEAFRYRPFPADPSFEVNEL